MALTNETNPMLAKVWILFNGTGTIAIINSYNVTSITDNGTANYTVTFTNAFDAAENYSPVGMAGRTGGAMFCCLHQTDATTDMLSTSVHLQTQDANNTAQDCARVSIAIHGDPA